MDPSGFRTTIEAAGSEGVIEFDSRQNPTLRLNPVEGMARAESLMHPEDDPYFLQLRSFLDAVGQGTPPPVSAEDGLEAVRISLAAIESARTGLPVNLA
jgi:myo-inositol 2-dehydrogenase/D-chiro-inositol 1-dehydrogenase